MRFRLSENPLKGNGKVPESRTFPVHRKMRCDEKNRKKQRNDDSKNK